MIKEMTFFGAICDNCGETWQDDNTGICALSDKSAMQYTIGEEDWKTEDDKTYCPDCWSYGDDDEMVLKQMTNDSRTNH